MRWTPAAVVLAIACSSPPAKKNVPPPEPDPAPPVATEPEPDLPAATVAPVLGLTPAQVDRVRAYERAVRDAVREGDPPATCAAMAAAYELVDALQTALADRRDALFDKPEYDALIDAVKQLGDDLPGVGFAVGAETLYAWVDHADFVKSSPAAAIADKLLANYPSWMVQKTDIGGCVEHENAFDAVDQYAASWDAAPACQKSLLGPKIRESLESMAGSMCFCGDAAGATKGAAAMADRLAKIPAFADLAPKVRAAPAARGAQLHCTGP